MITRPKQPVAVVGTAAVLPAAPLRAATAVLVEIIPLVLAGALEEPLQVALHLGLALTAAAVVALERAAPRLAATALKVLSGL